MYQYNDGLETDRLRTRFLTPADAATWAGFFNDPETARFIPNDKNLAGEERAKDWISFCITRYKENRYGLQALIEKSTGTLIGQCGLLLQQVNGVKEIEIGYHLLPSYWGKGYAIEAARCFRDYAFGQNMASSIVSLIHPDNTNSQKVALNNGMTLTGKTESANNNSWDIFRITCAEWEELKNFNG